MALVTVTALVAWLLVAAYEPGGQDPALEKPLGLVAVPFATTTTVAPTTTTEAPRPTTRPSGAPARGPGWTSSTNYCLRGTMASGLQVHDGAVAVNSADWGRLQGTSWKVVESDDPAQRFVGRIFVVQDHGPAARFDIWVPTCAEAVSYGLRHVRIEPA